jgi:Predicted integral membrane protein (DUF2269)
VRVFVFLHVLSMVSAVAVAYGPAVLMRRAGQTRNVPTIRGVFGTARSFGVLIPVFFLTGLAFAILAIITEHFNPLQPWLLTAYVLFAIGLFDGIRIHAPYALKVADAADRSPDSAPSAELEAALDNRGESVTYWLDLGVITLILFDMIVKPFS